MIEFWTDKDRREIGYLCSECARKMKWRWPKGHMATCHSGLCDVCGKEKRLSCENDWLRPGEKHLREWD